MSEIITMFGAASLISGLIAAAQWYRASKIAVKPNLFELSDDAHDADVNWEFIRAMMVAGKQMAALNEHAALWTAAAVLLSGITSLLTALAMR